MSWNQKIVSAWICGPIFWAAFAMHFFFIYKPKGKQLPMFLSTCRSKHFYHFQQPSFQAWKIKRNVHNFYLSKWIHSGYMSRVMTMSDEGKNVREEMQTFLVCWTVGSFHSFVSQSAFKHRSFSKRWGCSVLQRAAPLAASTWCGITCNFWQLRKVILAVYTCPGGRVSDWFGVRITIEASAFPGAAWDFVWCGNNGRCHMRASCYSFS